MNVKPILFNTEMVQAILDGRKTEEIRIIVLPKNIRAQENGKYTLFSEGDCYSDCCIEDLYENGYLIPKYRIGDILWVRETFCDCIPYFGYLPDIQRYVYKTNETQASMESRKSYGIVWTPSIHMPKEAARIFLRVTDIKVEKLQDITDEQAIKEGFEGKRCTHINRGEYGGCTDCMNTGWLEPPQLGFMESWNSTVKKDCEKWSTNPYVWVISFERCEKPEGWCK